MDKLFLDGGVERFRHGIIKANPRVSDRRDDPIRQRHVTEVAARVLATSVRMDDNITDARTLPVDRHRQRIGNQARAHLALE
jgi:hypothetical protein